MSYSSQDQFMKTNTHKELSRENIKLHHDVCKQKNALKLHYSLQQVNSEAVKGATRQEVDGCRWQYGGKGKLTTYKTGEEITGETMKQHRPSSTKPVVSKLTSQNSNMNRPQSANLRKINPKTIEDLEKLKKEIDQQRALLEEKYHLSEKLQKDIRRDAKDWKKVCKVHHTKRIKTKKISAINDSPSETTNSNGTQLLMNDDSLFNTDYLEIDDKKNKVLEKVSTKVIYRTKPAQTVLREKTRKPEISFGRRVEKAQEKIKPVKSSKLRVFRSAEPAIVINDLEKGYMSTLENVEFQEDGLIAYDGNKVANNVMDKDIVSSQKYLSEPQEEVLGLNRTLSRIKAEQEQENFNKLSQTLEWKDSISPGTLANNNVIDELKLEELLKSARSNEEVKKTITSACDKDVSNDEILNQFVKFTRKDENVEDKITSDSLRLNLEFINRVSDKFNFSDSCTSDDEYYENSDNAVGVSANSQPIDSLNLCSDRTVTSQNDNFTSHYSSDVEVTPETSSLVVASKQKQKTCDELKSFPESICNEERSANISGKCKSSPSKKSNKKSTSEKADRFVKAWLRNLGVQDVQKTAQVFARNNIGMAVMKYVTEGQVREMNFCDERVIEQIVEGIQILKLTSSSKSLMQKNPEEQYENNSVNDEKFPPNVNKRQSRRDKVLEEVPKVKNNPVCEKTRLRTRSTSRIQQKADKNIKKGDTTKKQGLRTRSNSRGRDILQKRLEEGVTAAAQRKLEKEKEERKEIKEKEKHLLKKKQRRDKMAAKHQEREEQKSLNQTLDEAVDFKIDYEDDRSPGTTGRSTALDHYLTSLSSRICTPHPSSNSSHIRDISLDSTDRESHSTSTNTDADISSEQAKIMIQSLLSAEHLQNHMSLTLVKNLKKQLEDVENRIRQKQQQTTGTSEENIHKDIDMESSNTSVHTPIPDIPLEKIYRCDSEVGIWDPSQTSKLLSGILPSLLSTDKTVDTESTTQLTCSTEKKSSRDRMAGSQTESPVKSMTPTPKARKKTVTINENKPTSVSEVAQPKPSGKGSVASLSMSKRALLDEIKKEKDEHRKEIRHLQSELSRLQHKDPVRKSEVPAEDIIYNEKDLLGEGAFSMVYRGTYQAAEVAVKRLKVSLSSQDKNYFAAEVSLLRELRHPRVVMLIGVCTETKLPLMILEYMSKGNLYFILHDKNRPPLDHVEFYQIARDVTAGMVYLHNYRPPILHLDLKSMNVLIGAGDRAKIADFGFSKLKNDAASKKQIQGSPSWMAPELLLNGEVTVKADVYSFGIILWEMMSRRHPYEGCTLFQILEHVRLSQRPEIPDCCPEGLRELLERCWHQKPSRRPVFNDILKTIESLSFPPKWRALFEEAGIPHTALNDIESTRNIISLVNSTLDSGNLQAIVKQYNDTVQSEDVSSPTSVSEDISLDSLDDDLGSISSKDSFDKIQVKAKIVDITQNNSVRQSKYKDIQEGSSLSEENEAGQSRKQQVSSAASSNVQAMCSPKKSKNFLKNTLAKKEKEKMDTYKSKEAWNIDEDCVEPFHHVPEAPPPPPTSILSQTSSSSSNIKAKSVPSPNMSSKTYPQKPDLIRELDKEMAMHKNRKPKYLKHVKSQVPKTLDINVAALKKQRNLLKPVDQIDSTQFRNLNNVPREAITSIAEILKKAMAERRFAIGEVGESNDCADWSLMSEISMKD